MLASGFEHKFVPGVLFTYGREDVRGHAALIARYAAEAYLAATEQAFLVTADLIERLMTNVCVIAQSLDINLLAAIAAKHEKNKARTWAINDGLAQHISEGAGYVR
jgi:hypothetical protein